MTEISDIEAYAKDILDLWEHFKAGKSMTYKSQPAVRRLVLAACFGAAAYEKCNDADQSAGIMLEAILIAMSDPCDARLDHLRGNAWRNGVEAKID